MKNEYISNNLSNKTFLKPSLGCKIDNIGETKNIFLSILCRQLNILNINTIVVKSSVVITVQRFLCKNKQTFCYSNTVLMVICKNSEVKVKLLL